MTTIKEDYVSFEIAKLLKEKGFNECPLFRYDDCGHLWVQGGYNKTIKWHFPAPTLQMAMKWLRKEKGIAVVPILSSVLDNEKFLWDVKITVAKTNESYRQGWTYESYERACETAIGYSLENLI